MKIAGAVALLAALLGASTAFAAETPVTSTARWDATDCADPSGISSDTPYFNQVTSGLINPSNTPGTVDFATDFMIEYFNTYKVVTQHRANEQYVLWQCGTAEPSRTLYPNAKYFQIPLYNVAAQDSTVLAFFDLLQIEDRLAVYSYALDACMQKSIDSCDLPVMSDIITTPWDFATSSGSAVVDTDAAGPYDAIISNYAGENEKSIAFSATSDPGMLNRAEWIKFVAAFFNKEATANNIFDNIIKPSWESDTIAISDAASAPKMIILETFVSAPSGVWGDPIPAGTPGTSVSVKFTPYLVDLVTTAGGAVIAESVLTAYGGTQGVTASATSYSFDVTDTVGLAAFLEVLAMADVVLDMSYPQAPYAPFDGNMVYDATEFELRYSIDVNNKPQALVNNKVYTTDFRVGQAGSDWFQGASVLAHEVLRDMRSVLDQTGTEPFQRRWMRRLDESPVVVSGAQCTDNDVCSRSVNAICPRVYTDCAGTLVVRTQDTSDCPPLDCPNNNNNPEDSAGGENAASSTVASMSALVSATLGAAVLLALAA